MYFENHLTADDLQRAHDICPNPPPAKLMAGSFCALLEAIDTRRQHVIRDPHPSSCGSICQGMPLRRTTECR